MPITSVADQALEKIVKGQTTYPIFTDTENRRHTSYLRNAMLSARRYYLTDDAVVAMTEFGYVHPELLYANLLRARAPFEKILIDYSPKIQVGTINPAQVAWDAPERSGIFVERIAPTLFRMTGVSADTDFATFNAFSVRYDIADLLEPHGPDFDIIRSSMRYRLSRSPLILTDPKASYRVNGADYPDIGMEGIIQSTLMGQSRAMFGDIQDEEQLRYYYDYRERLEHHGRIELSPVMAPALKRIFANERQYPGEGTKDIADKARVIISNGVIEWSGSWRLLLSALIMLNAQDFVTEERGRIGANRRRFVGGTVVPFLEHRRVLIKVPREVAVRRAVQTFSNALPRRWHEVEGHYRHRRGVGNEIEQGHPGACNHVWINLTETREKCFTCGYDRWFVAEFGRGDASVGVVTKDRVVEPKHPRIDNAR